jgi:polysaccharide chain length determinant protein (PEP-CTERM system associated)
MERTDVLPGRKYTPADIFQLAWAHKWLILIPWVIVAASVAAFTRTLDNRYVSESLLQIVAARIPQNLVRSSITTSIEDRLPIITAQIMTRTRLERLIQDFDLYAEQRRSGALIEDILRDMRESHIKVVPIKGDAFRVSYETNDAALAMRVTEKLAGFFVEESMRDREIQADATNVFLEGQLEEARRRLFESEKMVEEYTKLHRGELPSQLTSNLATQASLENRLAQNQENLLRDKDRRSLVERNLIEAEAELQAAQQLASVTSEPGPTVAMSAAQQLEQARAAYAQMRTKMTDEHPDMQTAAKRLRELEAIAEKETLTAPVSGSPRARNAAEGAGIKRIAELRNELSTLDSQIAQRDVAAKQLQRQIADVQRRIDATPTRDTEMIAITRDYETLKAIYTSLFQRSEDAKVAANLERRQIGEQFKIIDPARMPERPVSPNRPQLYLGGLFGGLLVGVALVGLLEYRDSSFRTDTDIVSVLALPVLATIPAILSRDDRAYLRRKRLYLCAAAGLAGVMAVGAIVVWRPDLLQRVF